MFGDKLKELRKSRHLTQEQLAAIIGVERSSIGKYEGKDKIVPSDDVKYKIAEFFSVSVDWLMEKTDVRFPTGGALTPDENEILAAYRELNDAGKKVIGDMLRMFLANPDYRQESILPSAK